MQDCKENDILVVTTTVGSVADARTLAQAILGRRLAACVQVEEGLTSFYRWDGKDCADAEVRLTIKTTPARETALRELFDAEHPYELPQFVCWGARASTRYAQWVGGEVGAA